MARKSNLLITGSPGVGKTTLVRRVAASLEGRSLRGFVTEEIRTGGRRVGFAIESFTGSRATLAHVDLDSRHRVGRYRVDVRVLDEVTAEALAPEPDADIFLIDEIGKMECLSERFIDATVRLLDGPFPVLATVARKGGGFIAEVKGRPDVELWELSAKNRDRRCQEAVEWARGATG